VWVAAAALLAVVSLWLGLVRPASADGLIVPPPDYYGFETGQEAVIFHENGTQTMLLTTEFRGNAKDFAWIVPTPSIPEVSRGNWEMLVALRDITEQPIDDVTLGGFGAAPFAAETYVDKAAVTEIERTSIGYYDVAVLEARTVEGLLAWFDDNGYRYPEAGEYVLQDYIDAGWYFTAAKLRTNTGRAAARNVTEGGSLPLLFRFASDKIVFPMQLSQVAQLYSAPRGKVEALTNEPTTEAAPMIETETAREVEPEPGMAVPDIAPIYWEPEDSIGVTLYIIAADKQSLPGFDQLYAGYISAEAVRELSYGTGGEPVISPASDDRYVLTKLFRQFPVAEMTYDLYPRSEENVGLLNDEGDSRSKQRAVWIIAGVSAVLILILVGAIVLMAREPRQARTQKD
jgi:hypothetical protein